MTGLPSLSLLSLATIVISILLLLVWIVLDAGYRGYGAGFVLLLLAVSGLIVPAYLLALAFGRLPERSAPPSPLERGLGTAGIGGTLAVAVGGLFAPPDIAAQIYYRVPLLPAGFAVGYVLTGRVE